MTFRILLRVCSAGGGRCILLGAGVSRETEGIPSQNESSRSQWRDDASGS